MKMARATTAVKLLPSRRLVVILIVAGYLDQGGKGIIQGSLDTGAFDVFFLPDGMIGDSLPAAIGPDLNGSIGSLPGMWCASAAKFAAMAEGAGFAAGPFAAESYDAAALLIMAMQAAGSTDSQVFKGSVSWMLPMHRVKRSIRVSWPRRQADQRRQGLTTMSVLPPLN